MHNGSSASSVWKTQRYIVYIFAFLVVNVALMAYLYNRRTVSQSSSSVAELSRELTSVERSAREEIERVREKIPLYASFVAREERDLEKEKQQRSTLERLKEEVESLETVKMAVDNFLNEKEDSGHDEVLQLVEKIKQKSRTNGARSGAEFQTKPVGHDEDRLHIVLTGFAGAHASVSDVMKVLRKTVGSIHKQSSQTHIVLYTFGIPKRESLEIRVWRNVEVVDMAEHFFESTEEATELQEDTALVLALLDAAEKFSRILYLSNGEFLNGNMDTIDAHIKERGHLFVKRDGRCYKGIQGYAAGGDAVDTVLRGTLHCIKTHCGKTLEDHMNTMSCEDLNLPVTTSPEGDDSCYLEFRDEWLYLASGDHVHTSSSTSEKTKIAFGVPVVTSSDEANADPSQLPLFSIFVNSLVQQISEEEKKEFEFVVYVGYDVGDPFFDNEDNLKKTKDQFSQMTSGMGADISLDLVRLRYTHGWTSFIWTALLSHAVADGCEYYYQLNDDLSLETHNGIKPLVEILRSSPILPNFGMTGPEDTNNNRLLTQSFFHKTHFEIFGFWAPYGFKNWYNDDWITNVYGGKATFRTSNVRAKNTNTKGTRYSICYNGKEILDREVEKGRALIRNWLDALPAEKRTQSSVQDYYNSIS